MLSLDHMLPLNNTSDHIFPVLFFKIENMLSSSLKFFQTNLLFHFGKQKNKIFYGYRHEYFSHSHSF